jgi:hypothetical protein
MHRVSATVFLMQMTGPCNWQPIPLICQVGRAAMALEVTATGSNDAVLNEAG